MPAVAFSSLKMRKATELRPVGQGTFDYVRKQWEATASNKGIEVRTSYVIILENKHLSFLSR